MIKQNYPCTCGCGCQNKVSTIDLPFTMCKGCMEGEHATHD